MSLLGKKKRKNQKDQFLHNVKTLSSNDSIFFFSRNIQRGKVRMLNHSDVSGSVTCCEVALIPADDGGMFRPSRSAGSL